MLIDPDALLSTFDANEDRLEIERDDLVRLLALHLDEVMEGKGKEFLDADSYLGCMKGSGEYDDLFND
jgi:hypothetical protein